MTHSSRHLEKAIAAASFIAAVAFAFTSLLIAPSFEVAANNMLVVAQFLTFTATILGIDYRFNSKEP